MPIFLLSPVTLAATCPLWLQQTLKVGACSLVAKPPHSRALFFKVVGSFRRVGIRIAYFFIINPPLSPLSNFKVYRFFLFVFSPGGKRGAKNKKKKTLFLCGGVGVGGLLPRCSAVSKGVLSCWLVSGRLPVLRWVAAAVLGLSGRPGARCRGLCWWRRFCPLAPLVCLLAGGLCSFLRCVVAVWCAGALAGGLCLFLWPPFRCLWLRQWCVRGCFCGSGWLLRFAFPALLFGGAGFGCRGRRACVWSWCGCRLRSWVRSTCAFCLPFCCGVSCYFVYFPWCFVPFCAGYAVSLSCSCGGRLRSGSCFYGVSFAPVSARSSAVCLFLGLLLWSRFWFLGIRSFCGGLGLAGCGVSVWLFAVRAPSFLGCVGVRRCRCLGVWFSVSVPGVTNTAFLGGVFVCLCLFFMVKSGVFSLFFFLTNID